MSALWRFGRCAQVGIWVAITPTLTLSLPRFLGRTCTGVAWPFTVTVTGFKLNQMFGGSLRLPRSWSSSSSSSSTRQVFIRLPPGPYWTNKLCNCAYREIVHVGKFSYTSCTKINKQGEQASKLRWKTVRVIEGDSVQVLFGRQLEVRPRNGRTNSVTVGFWRNLKLDSPPKLFFGPHFCLK